MLDIFFLLLFSYSTFPPKFAALTSIASLETSTVGLTL